MNGQILDPLALWGRQDMTREQMNSLIAAAPDLLALLVESEKIILSMGEVTPGSAAHSFLIDCRAVIAKAKNTPCYTLATTMKPGEATS